MEFKDKVILISGATGGIGQAIVHQLSKERCKIALFSRREKKLEEICKNVENQGAKCIYKKCDVKNKYDIQKAVTFTKKEFGKIDIAILTAGVLVPNPIETFDSNIIKDSMEINFLGHVYFIESLLSVMKSQKSGIIAAVSTLPDRRGVPGWGAYGASKAAVSWLMESLRAEAKQKYNIQFITIKPGSVKTPMIKDYYRRGAIPAEIAAEIIITGIKKEKKIIQFPLTQVVTTRLMDMFPVFTYDSLDIEMMKGEDYPIVKEK